MRKTSWQVTERYHSKAYDRIVIKVKKGKKEEIQKQAADLGKSLNGYICDLIEHDRKKSENSAADSGPDPKGSDKLAEN